MEAYADNLAYLFDYLELKDAVMVGHSTGVGEVARYISRHGVGREAKAVLLSALSPHTSAACRRICSTPSVRAGSRAQYLKDFAGRPSTATSTFRAKRAFDLGDCLSTTEA